MKFTHRITWNIGLNRGGVPYPPSEAIEAVRVALADRGLGGFTVTPGTGYWQGQPEDCLTVTLLVVDAATATVACGVAYELADALGQEAVAWAVDTLAAGGLAFS